MTDQRTADRWNYVLGGVTTLIALVAYLKTVAVSVSLWDCGEFIACSPILGIPHPPGTPLFILLGRIFSLIPFSADVAHRINLISAFSSAAAVGFAYFALSRIIGWWLKQRETFWQRLPMYLGGITGALFMGLSRTWWWNAVEGEVYGLTSLISVVIVYLAVVWFERREKPESDKLIFAISYLSMLGIAVHMSSFLVMPAVYVFIFAASPRFLKDFRVWLTVLASALLMIDFNYFMYGTLIWLGISTLGRVFGREYFWKWAWAFTLLAILGFSVQFTTIVRAQHQPRINMNNASSWERFDDFLARKQYGQGNMLTRTLTRRGELSHQFGVYPRMGMLGFWREQYSTTAAPFALWMLIGLIGLYFGLKAEWKSGLLIFLLVFICTLGITWYMNFADGTKLDVDPTGRLEVRDRDYFWTTGFAVFGWAIGLGLAAILILLQNFLRSRADLQRFLRPASVVFGLTVLTPAFAFAQNYHFNNRSGEWMPYQFGYDMLTNCEKNAVLFTAGDNDTYPLWAVQEAYRYRQDVKIINLSLANVDWYILHVKNKFGAPMAIEDDQVEVKTIETPNGIERRPVRPYFDKFENTLTYFGSQQMHDPKTGRVTGIREMAQLVIEKVIEASLVQKGDTVTLKTPIYFTSLTDPVRAVRYTDCIRNIEKAGIMYRIPDRFVVNAPDRAQNPYPFTYNLDATYDMFVNKFTFAGMGEPGNARNEFPTMMAFRYYASEYSDLIDTLLTRKDSVRAVAALKKALRVSPEHYQVPQWHVLLDSLAGQKGPGLRKYQDDYVDYLNELIRLHPENYFYRQFISQVLMEMGQKEGPRSELLQRALKHLKFAYQEHPEEELNLENLAACYVRLQDTTRLQELIRSYVQENPNDYYRPIFMLAADWLDGNELENLEGLLKGYFAAVGEDPFVFREFLKYAVARQNLGAITALSNIYFKYNPNDRESRDFFSRMFQAPQPSGPTP